MRNTWIYRETRALLHSLYSSVFRVGFRGFRVFRVGFRVFRVGFRVFRVGFRVFRVGFRVFRVGSGCSGWGSGFYRHPNFGPFRRNFVIGLFQSLSKTRLRVSFTSLYLQICTFITVSHLQATNVGLIFVVHSSRRIDFRFQIKIKEFNA
jgi:hypothetical protein